MKKNKLKTGTCSTKSAKKLKKTYTKIDKKTILFLEKEGFPSLAKIFQEF